LQVLTHLIRAPTQELTAAAAGDVVAPAKEDAMANDESVPAPEIPKEASDAAYAAAPDATEIPKEASDAANAAAPAPAAEVSLDASEIGVFAARPVLTNHGP
jgi:hypothetical protein